MVESFADSREDLLVELGDVFLGSDLDGLSELVEDAFEDLGGVGVLFVGAGQKSDEHLQLPNEFEGALEASLLAFILASLGRLVLLVVTLGVLRHRLLGLFTAEVENGLDELGDGKVDLEEGVEVAS